MGESLKKMRATRRDSLASQDARNGCKEIARKLRRLDAALVSRGNPKSLIAFTNFSVYSALQMT